MYIILGATGHVGSAVANALLEKGEPVTIITRDARKADTWKQKGAHGAITDVQDVARLQAVFRQGKRLFLLNPPAPPSTDTAAEERKNMQAILAALDESGLEKIVVQSTYGAQPGDRVGDLGVLYELEQALARQPIPTSVIRGAYYMSNWEYALHSARAEGKVYAYYPADFKLPMVAPNDIGQVAARLLTGPVDQTGLHYVEGPELYSPADVAAAFSTALQKPVEAVEIPRDQWKKSLKAVGFSDEAAESMANMTAATLDTPEFADNPIRGTTSLQSYIADLVKNQQD
ncbi:uncharacterized protein YbjT (DUF2867 family) [Larkinella arboricola]|uniref:Uncharacterized protein YbjT (DUF2867 family) n=1 Tax=Larkinella arboricola TaxID=643671 RepID=A0A327WRZ4_LARAB|nr:NmrA family NAD(P)-binding protein [Larkinella arboricola]RAJ95502.1 uncharacterized protein YbjT (DUF2867 family) [Larkinella arboricola]